APEAASVTRIWGCSRMILRSLMPPCTTKGADTAVQTTQCSAGRNPSMICISQLLTWTARGQFFEQNAAVLSLADGTSRKKPLTHLSPSLINALRREHEAFSR